MNKKLIIKQRGFKDCGVACLLSVIRYYNGNISTEELSYLIRTTSEGVNAYSMIEGMKKIGFNGYGVSIDFSQLVNSVITLPVVAHTQFSNMTHFVVIYKINTKSKTLKLMDPNFGFRKVSFSNFEKEYLSTILYFYPEKPIPKLENKNSFLLYILKYSLKYKNIVIWIILLSILTLMFTILNSYYFKIIIDYVLVNFTIELLAHIFLIFFVFVVSKNILEYIRGKLLININNRVSIFITNEASRHIMCLPYAYFKNKPTGEITSRLLDLENFKNLLSNIVVNIFVNILMIIMSMMVLIFINKTLFLFSLLLIFLYFIIATVYSVIFKFKIRNIEEEEGVYTKELTEYIEGYETIKNLNLINKIIFKLQMRYNSLSLKIKNFSEKVNSSILYKNLVNDLGLLLINSIGLYFVYKQKITLGDLIVFNSLVLFFTEPLKQILDLEPNIRYAITSYERINDLLMIKEESYNDLDKLMINGNICIKNLTYSYNYLNNIVDIKDLTINDKDKILLYGKSGNGKSTLMKIILKYLNEYSGSIMINNINLVDINTDIIRNSFVYVSQNERLFCDTIKSNIILERDTSEDEYNEVIKISRVDEIINSKKLRNDFLIEENGFNLSGGEKQKIILARALLKKSNYIILDEALSEVDFSCEKEIIKNIIEKYEEKTIIYISHKEEIISMFNHKFFFEERSQNA